MFSHLDRPTERQVDHFEWQAAQQVEQPTGRIDCTAHFEERGGELVKTVSCVWVPLFEGIPATTALISEQVMPHLGVDVPEEGLVVQVANLRVRLLARSHFADMWLARRLYEEGDDV